jgi:hypothetical protein
MAIRFDSNDRLEGVYPSDRSWICCYYRLRHVEHFASDAHHLIEKWIFVVEPEGFRQIMDENGFVLDKIVQPLHLCLTLVNDVINIELARLC